METLKGFFQIFKVLLPFFRELLFGEKEEGEEAVRRNKIVVFMMGCLLLFAMFYFHNVYEYSELVAINNQLDENVKVTQAKMDALKQQIKVLQDELSMERSRMMINTPLNDSNSPNKTLEKKGKQR